MSVDTQGLESYVTGYADGDQNICHRTHRGQSRMSLDTPTEVRVYVTGHAEVGALCH